MNWPWFQSFLAATPLAWVALTLFAAMCAAAAIGVLLKARRARRRASREADGQEGYIVSAVLGLLALLMGFTFSLAVERFEARRLLALQEANAIGTTYLRAQLLTEPHRARMNDLLLRYIDNRIILAKAKPDAIAPYLAVNDALVVDMWAATSAAFDTIKSRDFSSVYLNSVNEMIDLDTSRKAARLARVPSEVFAVLFIYLVTTAGVLGYVLRGVRGRLAAGFLLLLLTLSLSLIVDINRPTLGLIVESQGPMEMTQRFMHANPPATFDRWRTTGPATP
jgi:hypothetical protein